MLFDRCGHWANAFGAEQLFFQSPQGTSRPAGGGKPGHGPARGPGDVHLGWSTRLRLAYLGSIGVFMAGAGALIWSLEALGEVLDAP